MDVRSDPTREAALSRLVLHSAVCIAEFTKTRCISELRDTSCNAELTLHPVSCPPAFGTSATTETCWWCDNARTSGISAAVGQLQLDPHPNLMANLSDLRYNCTRGTTTTTVPGTERSYAVLDSYE
eukprot:3240363-Rhodomonas_salina.1